MSLPLLTPFTLLPKTYRQKDYYIMLNAFVSYWKNYNNNLLQFATGIYITPIANYILQANNYIQTIFNAAPIPFANPWNIYSSASLPPSPPSTTGWTQDQIDIIEAITNATNNAYNTVVGWYTFIVENKPPQVPWISNKECQDIALQYTSLLIRQYQGLSKAMKTIAFNAYLKLLNWRIGFDIQNAFAPQWATGQMLDILAGYFNIQRHISFQTKNTSYTTLTDSQLRIVLYFTILCYQCNFSYYGLAEAIYSIFQNQITVSSKQDMTLTYYIITPIDSDMYVAVYYLISVNRLPAPMGVWVKYVILTDNPKPVFSFSWSNNFGHPALANKTFGWSNTQYQNILIWSGNITEV